MIFIILEELDFEGNNFVVIEYLYVALIILFIFNKLQTSDGARVHDTQ